jgi:hypothetical protein
MEHATGPFSSQSPTTGASPTALLDAEFADPITQKINVD